MIALLVASAATASAQTKQEIAKQNSLQPAPFVLAVLKKGETKEIQLCWDAGTGRAPVTFLGHQRVLTDGIVTDNPGGVIRYQQNGVTAEFDKAKSTAVQSALYKTGQYTGRQDDGSYKHVTITVVRVTANPNANVGAHSVFVHVVSGTGRSMQSSGEIRVLVGE
ncbi:hypothetical protein Poly59_45550 [Rubripirellula reticaptiva]|uniref:Uncharacterized protein n=2 Tax=Rubripirellula reticaptiva TaxID=2528013 RepID=A0A5C6EGV8_9BACT|nr:hypothetical protein Poly59_45550 [Rubripirellula reticaptiva]